MVKWPYTEYAPKLYSDYTNKIVQGMDPSYAAYTVTNLKQIIEKNFEALTGLEMYKADMRERFAKVKIYFKDMSVLEVMGREEFPDMFSFLSTLGGAMSLYLGMSIIAAFELLEFLIRLIISGTNC